MAVMKHGLMIDMDGVIYAGDDLIKGADVFVKRLLKDKIPFTFLSNNSSKSRADAVEKLAKLGIKVTEKAYLYQRNGYRCFPGRTLS
jgi:NagD protein